MGIRSKIAIQHGKKFLASVFSVIAFCGSDLCVNNSFSINFNSLGLGFKVTMYVLGTRNIMCAEGRLKTLTALESRL